MSIRHKKNFLKTFASLLGIAGASALLGLPALAKPNANSNIFIAQSTSGSGSSTGGSSSSPTTGGSTGGSSTCDSFNRNRTTEDG